MAGPLEGVRVLELAGLGPAPFCAMFLADLGADVLRIDRPAGSPRFPTGEGPGDRGAGSGGAPQPEAHTNPWDVLNRNRTGVAVDLRSEAGRRLVHELAERADVLIEGFRPGVAERLGVGPDDLLGVNPRLVYGRMTGWGRNGPLAPRAGHDLNYAGLAGAIAHIGRRGQPPTPPLNLVADFGGGGMLLAAGILAALVERQRSDRGAPNTSSGGPCSSIRPWSATPNVPAIVSSRTCPSNLTSNRPWGPCGWLSQHRT